ICVHCGGDKLRFFARHKCGCKHIVRYSVCDFADDICTCRGDHKHIGELWKGDMLNLKLKVAVKGVNDTLVARQAFKGYGVYKIGCVLSHQNMYIGMKLYKH